MYEHKNIYKLIEAFKLLLDSQDFNGKLVLVCKKDKFSLAVREFIDNKISDLRIRRTLMAENKAGGMDN